MRCALAFVVALLAPASAQAYCRTTTSARQPDPTMCPSQGSPIAWTTGCTGIRINPAVAAPGISPAQFRLAVSESVRSWQTVICDATTRAAPSFELVLLADTADLAGYEDAQANTNVVTFRATWGDDEFHDPNAAAITVVTFGSRTGAILDADTEFNLRARYPFSFDGGPGTTDVRTVATHEFGHTQGLAHSPDRSAVMWYTAGQGERRRTPNADDVAGLCAVYPPDRAVRCDPDLRAQTLMGGGAACGASHGTAHGALFVTGVALALAAGLRARRRFVATARRS